MAAAASFSSATAIDSQSLVNLLNKTATFKAETYEKATKLAIEVIGMITHFNKQLQKIVLDTDAQKSQSASNKIELESYKELLKKWVFLINQCAKIDKICVTILGTIHEDSLIRLDLQSHNDTLQTEFEDKCQHSLRGLHHRFRIESRNPNISATNFLINQANSLFSRAKRHTVSNDNIKEETIMIFESLIKIDKVLACSDDEGSDGDQQVE